MPQVNAEQLDKEADELLKSMAPPAQPDTDQPGQVLQDGDEPTQVIEKENEPAPATPEAPQVETPPPEDTGEEGLTLDNAKERIRNAQARMHRATKEAADLRKKLTSQDSELSAVRSELHGLKQHVEALKQQPPAKPESATVEMADAELQGIAEEYPQIAKPFIKVINALNAQVKSLGTKLESVEGKVVKTASSLEERDEDAAAQAHVDAIRAVHPDAFELYESGDFQGWLDRQPPAFAEIMQNGTANDVNYVFTQYKRAVGTLKDEAAPSPRLTPEQERIARAKAAANPTIRQVRTNPNKPGKPTFTRAEIAKMTPEEFESREAEIDAAIADGRIT